MGLNCKETMLNEKLKLQAARYRFLRDGEYSESLLEMLVARGVHKYEVDAAIDNAHNETDK